MREREEDRGTGDPPAVPLPNQGGIGSSEHGGTVSSDLIPDDHDERDGPRKGAERSADDGTEQGPERKARARER